ncbi:hypothetical protein [Poriferisphaera sp. WC338]|uniref:hypothetical protein n=1 Tax=Poriferisphaera sp. WC338 TaxID=3425129 RepID=UPI003D816D4B
MTVENQSFTYTWVDNWATIPDTESGRKSGRTHGAVVTSDGNIVIYNQADPGILIFSPEGELLNAWGSRFFGAHGMSIVNENGTDYLWLTDEHTGEVVKTTLDGQTIMNIEKPDHPAYDNASYIPTWVAVNEERHGGNGDIWVADGYGSSLVHRYDKDGNWISALSGEQGAGHFKCPHSVAFRTDKASPELYIADRGNERLQIFDAEGNFLRVVTDTCHSPCSFTFHEGKTYIPELFTGIKILDENDKVITSVGDNDGITTVSGWPNLQGTEHVQPGKFNSPHDLTVDADGNIFVVEWIIGGRITKLQRNA